MIKCVMATSSMNSTCDGGVLVFTFTGLVTRAALAKSVQFWAASAIHCRGKCGAVVDLTGAVWLERPSLDLGMVKDGVPHLKRAPVAFVVRPENEYWFQRYCEAQAQDGILRGTFTEVSAARAWVKQKGRLLAQDEQSRIPPSAQTARTPSAACLHP